MIHSFQNFLNESASSLKHVYHVLDIEKLEYVLSTNKISSKSFSNISTSRNKNFSSYVGDGVTSWFKLELDYKKLNKKYKNRSFIYTSQTNVSMPEEEEQQFLTNEISPAFDYITRIILMKGRLENSMYRFHNKKEPSDWMTDAPRPYRKIPQIIKSFVEKLKAFNMKFYVQEFDGTIHEDDKYVQSIIDHPIKHVDIYYAYAYRMNSFVKRFSYEDVIYDPIKNIPHRIVIGAKYPKSDFICLETSEEKLKKKYNFETTKSKLAKIPVEDKKYYQDLATKYDDDIDSYLPKEESKLYILTFRDIGSKYYLENAKPFDW